MPTGYTADVQDGKITTLPEFIRVCSRNFILDLRDEPDGTPIPARSECQASSVKHCREAVEAALNEIHRLHGLSPADAEREALAAYNDEVGAIQRRQSRKQESRARYEAMLAKINAWQAPPRMQNMKDFMVEQITKSIKFDCSPSHFDTPPQRQTGAEWLAAAIADLQSGHARYVDELAKAEEREKNWNEFYSIVRGEIARLEDPA